MDLEYELTNVAFHHVSRDPMGILVWFLTVSSFFKPSW
jgi:hypothetical protein